MPTNVVALRPSSEGGLTNYDHAKSAIAICDRIDDVKEWANKTKALAEYAKQAKDKHMEAMCKRIRLRAVRRQGELLELIESQRKPPSNGERGSRGRFTATTRAGSSGESRTAVAKEAGLTPKETFRAVNLARIPAAKFEEEVEKPKPPSVDTLAKLGVQHKPKKPAEQPRQAYTPDDKAIAEDLAVEAAMLARKFRKLKPEVMAAATIGTKRAKLKEDIASIIKWYQELTAALK